MKHSKSLHLPSYCDTQYTEWEFISDPFGNSYCNVLLNHSYVLVSGLGYQACAQFFTCQQGHHPWVSLTTPWVFDPSPQWPPRLKISSCWATRGGPPTPDLLSTLLLPGYFLSVRHWQWHGGTMLSGVWCVIGEVWIRSDSCTKGPAGARGRGSHRPSRTTSSPRR